MTHEPVDPLDGAPLPGGGSGQYRLPHGLDTLLLLAASDETFCAQLLEGQARLASGPESGLDAAERAVLGATSPTALRGMIARLRDRLSDPARRRFCAQASAALASLLAGGTLLGGAACAPRQVPRRPRPADPPRLETRRPEPVPVPYYPEPDGELLTGSVPRRRREIWVPEWQDPPLPPPSRP
jgi:hypothetical protein